MEKGRYFLFLISVFFVIFAIYGVSATLSGVTLVNPAANDNISGSYTFDASITGTGATNATFYWWNSTSSAWKLICYNSTGGAGPFTCSYDTSNLPEGHSNTFNVTATNSTVTVSTNNTGITVDNTAPVITINSPSRWIRQNVTISADVVDALTNVTNSTIYFWFENSTGNFSITHFTNCSYVNPIIGFNCSATFDTANLKEGNYTFWINASDNAGNVKDKSLSSGVDNTVPTGSFSCSPTGDISTTAYLTCTCNPSDSISGIDSSKTSYAKNPPTYNLGTFSLTCNFEDNAGNKGNATTSYTVAYVGGGGSAIPQNPQTMHSWDKITKGKAGIMKDFDPQIGLKQIIINVKNNATNVQITVMKYSGKPAEVSVAVNQSGEKVYQYFHVNTTNLLPSLKNAILTIRVNKTWLSANNLGVNNVSLYKFNETSSKWMELNTTYDNSDNNYDYYNASVTSFSYFAIAARSQSAQTQPSETPTNSVSGNLLWLWILLGVIAAGVIGFFIWPKFYKKVWKSIKS